MYLGYARVSTDDQNLDRQIDQLLSAGVDKRNIYAEKISGRKRDREELDRMLSDLKPEDVIIIADLTRISRSTRDLLEIVEQITKKGAYIKSIKDTWLDTTSDNPYNTFLLTVMSALSQLEADLTRSRVKEGLSAARKRGRVGGRPSKQNQYSDTVRAMAAGGIKISEIVRQTGVSRSTVQRILRKAL